jgi:hypothetical protein
MGPFKTSGRTVDLVARNNDVRRYPLSAAEKTERPVLAHFLSIVHQKVIRGFFKLCGAENVVFIVLLITTSLTFDVLLFF